MTGPLCVMSDDSAGDFFGGKTMVPPLPPRPPSESQEGHVFPRCTFVVYACHSKSTFLSSFFRLVLQNMNNCFFVFFLMMVMCNHTSLDFISFPSCSVSMQYTKKHK